MKDLKITPPEGYEVDKDKSTFEHIIYKKVSIEIVSVEDACKYLGEIDPDVHELRLLQNVPNLGRKTLAGQELTVVTKALNGDWVANFDNGNQYKYIVWWYLGNYFRLSCLNCYNALSDVPARLCYKSEKLANYSATTFKEIWRDFMN